MAAPDIQYCLDSMVELHLLSGDVYTYLMYFKDNLTNWFDNNQEHELLAQIEYNEWRKSTTQVKRAYTTFQGVNTLKNQAYDVCKEITHDAWKLANRCMPSNKQIIECMYDGKLQKRYMNNFNNIFKNAKADFKNISESDFDNLNKEIYEVQRKRYMIEFGYDDSIRKPIKRNVQVNKNKRKIITKSVNTLQNFLPAEDTKLFLGNNFVSITGQYFTFKVKKKSSLSNTGWNTLDINIHDKQSDEYLCKICFYYENMPTADQLTSLILDVNAGNEDKVIRTGNIFQITEKAKSHPTLLKFNDNNPKLLSNTNDFPRMEEVLLGDVNMNDFFGEIYDLPDNFDEIYAKVRRVFFNRMGKRLALFSGFSRRLALENNI